MSSCTGPILEPATGTGRILIPLLEKGFQVDGFDTSKDMLNICRVNCEKRKLSPYLFQADMESFSLDKKYDAIIIPTGTFLLMHDRAQSIKALKNFYKHLNHGGKLILDTFLQTDISLGKISTRTWDCDNGDVITLEDRIVKVDYINQYTISYGRYEKWRKGTLLHTELEPFKLRGYGIEELRMLLEQIGFSDIIISAEYEYGVYPIKPNQTITYEAFKK